MKILYITNKDEYSGSSIALLNLISSLKDKAEIEVVFPRKKGDVSARLEQQGIKCYHFRYTMSTYASSKLPFFRRMLQNIYNILIKYYGVQKLLSVIDFSKPDIIHTNNGPTEIGYICAKKRNIPHVWHLREYIDKDFAMHPIPSFSSYIKKYSDPINHCITITEGVKKHFGLKENAVTVYDGALIGQSLNIKEKDNYFLFVGRLQEAKGDLCLLKAFASYVRYGGECNLYYAGEAQGDRIELIKKYIEDQHMENRVKLLGFRSDVNHLMAKAKALFVPSRFEGFGFITAEAMYNHCLVVGRNTAGTKEQFDNGLKITGKEIGIRFNKDEEMTNIMHSISRNNYTDYIERAYSVVSRLYQSENNANIIFDLYKKILHSEQI